MITYYLAAAPVVIGSTARLWFGVFHWPVWYLRKGAEWLDGQSVAPVPDPVTIHGLREHDKCGDRIVVAHYLALWTYDLERKIRHNLLGGAAFSILLAMMYTVISVPALRAPTGTFSQFFKAMGPNIPISFLLGGILIEIVVMMKLVADQYAKHMEMIKAARPVRKPFFKRVKAFFSWSKTPEGPSI